MSNLAETIANYDAIAAEHGGTYASWEIFAAWLRDQPEEVRGLPALEQAELRAMLLRSGLAPAVLEARLALAPSGETP